MIVYTIDQIITMVQDASHNMSTFYSKGFVNYTGHTFGTEINYTEIIARYLLDNSFLFDQIKPISRASSYRRHSHDGAINNPFSGRDEEILAKRMFNQITVGKLGEILDYQVPLKNKATDDKTGKIDLLSYNESTQTLYILELKKTNSKETLLRCVLEAYTYKRIVDLPKLIGDYDLPSNVNVVACPLVFLGGSQNNELRKGNPNLLELIRVLNAAPVFYDYQIITS